jgi:hypothetical protein
MVVRATALALIAVLVAGCGPRFIPVVSSTDVDEANERIQGRRVTMTLKDGTQTPCERAVVGLDTCSCVDARVGETRRVPSSSIESIRIRRPGRGALKGLLYGGGATTLGATGMYWANPDEPYASVAFVFMPALGVLFGVPGGMLTESDVYEFPKSSDSEESPGEQ